MVKGKSQKLSFIGPAMFWAGLISLALTGSVGCSKEERDPCLQPRTTVMRVHSYRHADTGSAILDTALIKPLFLPLTDGGVQYYYGLATRSADFSLSLSQVADSSRWVIRPDSAADVQDTLTIFYQRQLRFLSNACGYTNFYNLDRVSTTHYAIDSAIINRSDVTNDANVLHLKLYY